MTAASRIRKSLATPLNNMNGEMFVLNPPDVLAVLDENDGLRSEVAALQSVQRDTRAATLREALAVVENEALRDLTGRSDDIAYDRAVHDCATAIRVLIDAPAATDPTPRSSNSSEVAELRAFIDTILSAYEHGDETTPYAKAAKEITERGRTS